MKRRYALRDDSWDRIKEDLPGSEGHAGVTARDNRLFVETVLYRYRAGIAWHDLPERLGDFQVIHLRHSRWSQIGLWQGSLRHWPETRITNAPSRFHHRARSPAQCGISKGRQPKRLGDLVAD